MSSNRRARACWRVGGAVAAILFTSTVAVHADSREARRPDLQTGAAGVELRTAAGGETMRSRCLVCHGAEPIVQQRLRRDGWAREIDKMVGWGAVVDARERETLLDYLASAFSRSPRVQAPSAADEAGGATLLETRCLACHDLRLIEQQRLTADGWRRELDKMTGWGAVLTDAEKAVLAAYLAHRFSAPSGP